VWEGRGGEIVVKFYDPIVNFVTVDVVVTEVTGGTNYPEESAEVFASQDGLTWVSLGIATGYTNRVGLYASNELPLGSLPWARYIKVVDKSDPQIFEATADGFDVLNIKALHGYLKGNNINPGDCRVLKFDIQNDGTKAMRVRVLPHYMWEDPGLSSDNVSIALCDGYELIWDIQSGPGGYEIYYIGSAGVDNPNGTIPAGDTVELCLKVCFDGELTDNDYQGKFLIFGITAEAIQASHDASEYEWGWKP
jgi:hypothetical protein